MNELNHLRILVIDDNPAIHDDFRKILSYDDTASEIKKMKQNVFGVQAPGLDQALEIPRFIVDSAFQGEEGLLYVKRALQEGKPYAMMFVDVRMPPGWDGIETIRRIWEIDGDIQAVICTAYSDFSWSEMVKRLGQTDRLHILKKPFDNIEILQFANSLTEKWKLRQQIKSRVDLLNDLVRSRTAELKKSLSITKATLESTTDGILVISSDGEIVDYNQKFANIWRVPLHILKTRDYATCLDFISDQLIEPFLFLNQEKEIQTHPEIEVYQELKLKNGSIIECYNIPHRMDKKIIGRVISFREVTERKQIEEQLQHLATYDMLTELPNRTLLLDRIRNAINISKRSGQIVAILFLDLDHFKNVNDSLGHSTGDRLLKELAGRLKQVIRETDTLARIGGDEFVVLLTGLTKEEDCTIVINKLLNIVTMPIRINGHELRNTCSIGISFYPANGQNAETLLKNADIAMYRVKATGRNNFKFYTDEMNESIVKRLQLETNLYRALENEEFTLHYQPIFNLNTGKIISVEALLRWNHPKLGLIYPKQFVQIAEEAGLISDIGEWVLKNACLQNKVFQKKGLTNIPVAINLSSQQIHNGNIVQTLKNILEETKLDSKFLELELTESIIINETEKVIDTMKQIRDLGISIVIDDFGTGYSCLSYLRRLPISKLKIDKSFTQYISINTDDVTIILAIISLAHNLNMRVIAEGVETKEQVEFLKAYQCDEVQGHYFCKPLEVNKFIEYIESQNESRK